MCYDRSMPESKGFMSESKEFMSESKEFRTCLCLSLCLSLCLNLGSLCLSQRSLGRDNIESMLSGTGRLLPLL